MLFNVEDDFHQQNNVAEENPDVCKDADSKLQEWHDDMMQSMPQPYDTDPLWTVMEEGGPYHAKGKLKAYCEQLKATGRGWAVEELKKRHPREFE